MLTVDARPSFKKQYKSAKKKRQRDLYSLQEVIRLLASESELPKKYSDHALKGNMQGYRACHVKRNWVLIYTIQEDKLILVSLGNHDKVYAS